MAGYIGVDGGSTSTKAALVDENGDIMCKAYQLSNGNPIEDTKQMFDAFALKWRIRARSWKCWAWEHRLCEGHFKGRAAWGCSAG